MAGTDAAAAALARRAPASALPILLQDEPLPAPHTAWAPEPCAAGLNDWVPRAATLRDPYPELSPARYRAQEKFNGAWVCWDGRTLWSRGGRDCRAPATFAARLPPGFAIVGELWLGYGHEERVAAGVLAAGNAPGRAGGWAEAGGAWRHARLVAFDAPGVPEWPYADRYALLRHVVGAWAQRLLAAGGPPAAAAWVGLPLLLARQYPLDAAPALFREVVEGVPWAARRYPGLGVPTVQPHLLALSATRNRVAMLATASGWREESADAPLFLDAPPARAAGEGCMLWDQTRPWSARGPGNQTTDALLKYKPIVASAATVARPPRHSHHRHRTPDVDAAGDDVLPGYRVGLRWWNAFAGGTWTALDAYIPSAVTPAAAAETYLSDRTVGFTFVLYDNQRPMYLRVLGTAFTAGQARAFQTHGRLSGLANLPGEAGSVGLPLERLLDPQRWSAGETHALFPCDFAWSIAAFCRYGGARRRIAASPFVVVGGDGHGPAPPPPSDARRAMRTAARAEAARRAAGAAAVRAALPRERGAAWMGRGWGAGTYLPRFLAVCVLRGGAADPLTHSRRAAVDIWRTADAGGGGGGSGAVLGVVRTWLEILVCGIAAARIRVGPELRRALRDAPDADTAVRLVDRAAVVCAELLHNELAPRWARAMAEAYAPHGPPGRPGAPGIGDPFGSGRGGAELNCAAAARYAMHAWQDAVGAGGLPPWEAILDDPGPLVVSLEAAACVAHWQTADVPAAALRTLREVLQGSASAAVDVALDPATALPWPIVAAPVAPLAGAATGGLVDDALSSARAAAMRAMRAD